MGYKEIFELIKGIIPLLVQLFRKKIKIKVFPFEEFREEKIVHKYPGQYLIKHKHELVGNDNCTGICITNDGKEDIRVDEVIVTVYLKKGTFRKTKICFAKGEKFKNGFSAVTIKPNGQILHNAGTFFDSSEKEKLIYEVIAITNVGKIKHVLKCEKK